MSDIALSKLIQIYIIAALGAPVILFMVRDLYELASLRSGRYDSSSDRAERISILAIRTNVAALVLIAIVGFAQIVWPKPADVETRIIRTDQSESDVRNRLSDLDSRVALLERRVEPPKPDGEQRGEPKQPDIKTEAPSVISWVGWLLTKITLFGVFVFAAMAWLSLFLFRSVGFIQNKAYRVATATLALGMGGVTLMKDSSLVKNTESLIKFNVSWGQGGEGIRGPSGSTGKTGPRGPKGERGPEGERGPKGDPGETVVLASEFSCGDDGPLRVEPFKDGSDELELVADTRLKEIVERLKERAANKDKGKELGGLFLIGSADKRPLREDLARRYGANDGLARARVQRIEPILRKAFPGIPIMELHAGPSRTGDQVPYSELAFDRAVQICSFWKVRMPATPL